jgi:hypothetical protein
MIVSDACTINIINDTSRSVNDAFRSVIENCKVTLQLWHHLDKYHDSCNMFIIQATVLARVFCLEFKIIQNVNLSLLVCQRAAQHSSLLLQSVNSSHCTLGLYYNRFIILVYYVPE